MRSRIFAFLTALLMLTALLPASALAYTDPHRSYERSNPLLPAAPDIHAPVYCAEVPAESPQYETDLGLLSAALRDAMEQRAGSITLYYRADHEITDEELNRLFEGAFTETGTATQGDYLRLSWQRYRIDVDCHAENGLYDHTITYAITYETTAAQEAELTAEIARILSGFGFTEHTTAYNKIRTIFDYICANITYDYEHLSDTGYRLKYTAYAALLHKTAVCEGYAELFYRMAIAADLHTRIITGRSNGDNHAWNIVELDGLYYAIDTTWAAMGDSSAYFLKGSMDFPDHSPDARCSAAAFLSLHPMADSAYALPMHIPYADVAETDYFHTPVLWATGSGITAGTAADRFSPHTVCTRAQAVTLLWRAAGSPIPARSESPFTDVAPTDYCYTAVRWAAEQGITGGIGDGLFGPDDTCTRAQIVTFLYSAARPADHTAADSFGDIAPGDYYDAPVRWAAAEGITSGTADGLFSPHAPCTRAQIVTFLYRIYE